MFSKRVRPEVRAKGGAGRGSCHTSGPANPAQPDIGIVVQVAQLGTDVRVTASRVAAPGLGEHALAAHTAQVGRQGRERVLHAVGVAFGRRAAPTVEILMGFIDQFVMSPIIVLDAGERRGRVTLEAADGVVVRAGEEDHLGRGAVVSDGIDRLLDAGGPRGHVQVVRLVHQAEDDVALRGVFLRQLGPEVAEVVVRWAALADDAAVPAGVVVHVQDAVRPGRETRLHDMVVGAEEGLVERTSEVVVDEVLPSDGKAEKVELVIVHKVLHLRRSDRAWATRGSRGSQGSLPMFSIILHPA